MPKKNKKISPPSYISEEEKANAFERILAEVPPPPSEYEKVQDRSEQGIEEPPQPTSAPEAESAASEKELPAFEESTEEKQGKGPVIEEGFELPDFDDTDIKELGKLKFKEKKIKENPVKEKKVKEEKVDKKPEPPPKIEYPKEEMPLIKQEPKFMDINTYFNIKEIIDNTGSLAEGTAESIGKHADLNEVKDEKYKALAKELNVVQDKLIFIDSQLFEGI